MLRHSLLTLLVAFVLTSCSTKNFPLDTVEKVEIHKYLGTWYEIARFEHFFEKDCKNVTANYSLSDDNKIKVINTCEKITTGEIKQAEGIAYAKDDSFSKLRVSFFRPFYGDYWIIMLDNNYKYAVIGTPSREYFWILARTKTISDDLKDKIITKMAQLQFDPKKIIWTIQE